MTNRNRFEQYELIVESVCKKNIRSEEVEEFFDNDDDHPKQIAITLVKLFK